MKTWDGQPVSQEPPHGASVIVYRQKDGAYEFLVLHRAHSGPDYEGEWAWTPPAGARLPGEAIEECAARELKEEAGLSVAATLTSFGSESWYVYVAKAASGALVELDAEHDRFEWLPAEIAAARCLPDMVGDSVQAVARDLGLI